MRLDLIKFFKRYAENESKRVGEEKNSIYGPKEENEDWYIRNEQFYSLKNLIGIKKGMWSLLTLSAAKGKLVHVFGLVDEIKAVGSTQGTTQ